MVNQKYATIVRLKCDLKPNGDHKTEKDKGNQENLAGNMDNDQIQLNSMKFNGNQWMSIDINEHQLISTEFNGNQLISTDINRFQLNSMDITVDQQEDDWVVQIRSFLIKGAVVQLVLGFSLSSFKIVNK